MSAYARRCAIGLRENTLTKRLVSAKLISGEQKANMLAPASKPAILVGPAGWSYTDWEGIVYPRHKPRGFHEAAYLAQFSDTIEINTTFYSPPRAEVVKSWAQRVVSDPAAFARPRSLDPQAVG